MQFDLISDLYIDSWEKQYQINWEGLGTSLVAVVIGKISHDFNTFYNTILEISKHYKHVLFVEDFDKLHGSERIDTLRTRIQEKFRKYRNISYLYRSPIILDQVAFVGCNGYTSFDFCEPFSSKQELFNNLEDLGIKTERLFDLWECAMQDSFYIKEKIMQLGKNSSIKKIVLVTCSIPRKELISVNYKNFVDIGVCGSSFLSEILDRKVNEKLSHWVFSGTDIKINKIFNNINFVSSPRGKQSSNTNYYPELIKV